LHYKPNLFFYFSFVNFELGMKHPSTIYLLLAATLTLGLAARGQRPVFGVYSAAGDIKCVPARGPSRPVVSLAWLYETDKLALLDNISEITLFDRDTSYIRLQGKGNYTIAGIEKMQPTRVRDTMIIRYLSFLWEDVIRPAPPASTGISHSTPPTQYHTPVAPTRALSIIHAPRNGYATSMDSIVFSWHNVSWARKYFLRLRNPDGQLCYDSVLIDTQAVVHFPGRMPVGNSYTWALDIVGESGRLQFADSGHITLLDETTILPQLPPVIPDSIGGFALILQRIEQYENAGCIRRAEALFSQLTTSFPQDDALDKLYTSFRRRNYF
jgi:hypothetical protein